MSFGFVGPRRTTQSTPTARAAPVRTGVASAPLKPRPSNIPFYDSSRVVDIDRLKIVKDMRQSGTERGETQTGDNGTLGPGSNDGGQIAPPMINGKIAVAQKPGLTGTQLSLLAVATYFLFGG